MQAVVKELSERELTALGAADSAVDNAARSPLYDTFVRRFNSGRITKRGDFETCRSRFVLGFRRVDSDETGTAEVTVNLRRVLVADAVKLCHHYFVWIPYEVVVTVRDHGLLKPGRYEMRAKVGNSEWVWPVFIYERRRA